MARKATGKSETKKRATGGTKARKTGTAMARSAPGTGGGRSRSQDNMGDAFIKLLQSPLVAELVAVAASAALAALAEEGFTSRDEGTRRKRTGKAVKAAGKAAAAAVGRRLSNEFDEIRAAAKAPKRGAKA